MVGCIVGRSRLRYVEFYIRLKEMIRCGVQKV